MEQERQEMAEEIWYIGTKYASTPQTLILVLSSFDKVHQIKEALLIISLLCGAIDLLNAKLLRVVPEFPSVDEAPCQSSHHLDSIFVD